MWKQIQVPVPKHSILYIFFTLTSEISETHLDDNILNHDLSFDGFDTIFRKDRIVLGEGYLFMFQTLLVLVVALTLSNKT